MKLIVGLGNPGEKYKNNRHNVGFMFVDYILEQYQKSNIKYQNDIVKFKNNTFLLSEICILSRKNSLNPLTPHSLLLATDLILAKPTTFMNISGKAVKLLTTCYKILATDLIVVHDDLDIPLGKVKIAKGTGPKLHNGIESIENHLHIKDFLRVRIGVDARTPENHIPGLTYVLQDFTDEEQKLLFETFPSILTSLTETPAVGRQG